MGRLDLQTNVEVLFILNKWNNDNFIHCKLKTITSLLSNLLYKYIY